MRRSPMLVMLSRLALAALLALIPDYPSAEPPLPLDPPAPAGVLVEPIPRPARQLISVPPPAAPARSFQDVILDVLRRTN